MSQSMDNVLIFRLNDNGQGPDLVREVFLENGWQEFDENVNEEFEWNMWWRTSRFRNCDYDELQPWQRLNHYPKSMAITKKDCLARNLKRMKGVYGASAYNFSPIGFNLPNDYTKFVAEYTKQKDKSPEKLLWICKPADLSRGRGIFIFRDLSELQYDCSAVLQQYITNPLLISGYKFDLRIYVLVPSFHPLQIYIYEEGLVRFSTEKYDLNSLGNLYSHLTNTSINKHSPSYSHDKERVGPGCKWTLTQLRHYLRQSSIDDDACWGKIVNIVIMTVIIQNSQVPKVPHCFELYGFDIIIDEHMKPWLLEVNFSPSLSSDCQIDIQVKKPMLHDLLNMMHFKHEDKSRGGNNFHQKQIYQLYGSPKIGKSLPRVSQKANPNQYKGGRSKLPNITKSSSSVTLGSSLAGEEEDGKEDEIIPIIPGCGLPSVQQLFSHRPTSSSTRSTTSSDDSKRSFRPATQPAINVLSPSKSSAAPVQHSKIKTHTTCDKSGQRVPESSKRKSKYPFHKQDSKNSMKSDSGISCQSGSSDNSDSSKGQTRDKPVSGSKYRLRGMTLSNLTRDQKTTNVIANSSTTSDSGSKPNQQNGFAHGAPTVSKSMPPTHQRRHYSIQERQSLKYMLNNRSITSDNFSSSRHFSQEIPGNPSGSSSFHSRPWRKSCGSNITDRENLDELSPRIGTKNPPSRVGNFTLVFPFNDTTKRCSLSTLDTKLVIRECHKLLKERTKLLQQKQSEIEPNNQPSVSFLHVIQFWGLLKEDGSV